MTTSDATLAAIDAEISELEERINSLQSARSMLVEEAEEASTPKQSNKATKSTSTKSRRREVVEDEDEDEKPARRHRKASSNSNSKSDAKKGGPSRKEVIAKMLAKGQSPREIADELGIQPNYVYHVKRDLDES